MGLGGVVTNVHLGGSSGVAGVLAGNLANLCSLCIDDLGQLLDLSINESLVGFVNQWAEEENRGADESETPERNDLNEVVGDESGEESSAGSQDILGEEKTLRLNNEKVDQLIQIPSHRIQSRLGKSIILPRPNLRGESRIEQCAPHHLSCNCNTKRHPCQLQSIAQEIKVARCEDEDHRRGVREGGRAGFLPAEQRAEERVVVG